MSKRKPRDISDALEIAGARQGPATTLPGGLPAAPPQGDEKRAKKPTERPRGLRKQRVGIVVYVDRETHYTLKRLALENECSLQELCTSAVMKLIGS